MGRELRMVPADWQHPKYPADHHEPHLRDRYIPLHDGNFAARDAEWNEGRAKWKEGFVENHGEGEKWRKRTDEHPPRYTEWAGQRPSPDDYMPDWPKAKATHFMMYEDTSKGTPISPAFATPEELARWLADTGASAFADSTATYDQWLSTIKHGFAIWCLSYSEIIGAHYVSPHRPQKRPDFGHSPAIPSHRHHLGHPMNPKRKAILGLTIKVLVWSLGALLLSLEL